MECEHTSGTLNLAWNASLGSKRKREELYLDIGRYIPVRTVGLFECNSKLKTAQLRNRTRPCSGLARLGKAEKCSKANKYDQCFGFTFKL
jgi:hypothetical protein